jgi:pyrimidine oxygenase
VTRDVQYGLFLPISRGGWIISKTCPQMQADYAYNRDIAVKAEELGFDFLLSMQKWRGFGGETDFWDEALESITMMSGLAEATSRIQVWSTVSMLAQHPVVTAKMAVTLDKISNGRAGLNLVAGAYPAEFTQMGFALPPHADRYAFAAEWTTVVRRLWEEERVDFDGRFFHVEDCISGPKPTSRPTLVCAGLSDTGMRFTATHCDIQFIDGVEREDIVHTARRAKAVAAELGSTTKVYSLFVVIPGETDAEAQARYRLYEDGIDLEAVMNLNAAYAPEAAKGTGSANMMTTNSANRRAMMMHGAVGSAETIADDIGDIVERGELDGVMLIFPEYLEDMAFWAQHVAPRLAERGLAPTPATA